MVNNLNATAAQCLAGWRAFFFSKLRHAKNKHTITMKKLSLIVAFLLIISIPINTIAQNAAAPLKLISFVLTPDAPDWNYKVDQNASVQVSVYRFGVPVSNATINYEIGAEQLPAEKKGSLVLKNGQGKIELGTSHQPGFRQLVVRMEYNGRSYSDLVKLAFSPEQIAPTVPLPVDFQQFWENAKTEAAKVSMDVD